MNIPLIGPTDGNHHHKTFLRQIARTWTPTSSAEAKTFLEECLAHAQALASVCTQYCWGDGVSEEDLKYALQVLDDLLVMSYSMLEFWHDGKVQP